MQALAVSKLYWRVSPTEKIDYAFFQGSGHSCLKIGDHSRGYHLSSNYETTVSCLARERLQKILSVHVPWEPAICF